MIITKPFYILSDSSLTIFHRGQLNTVASDVQNWDEIKRALATERYDDLIELIDQTLAFKNYVSPVISISVNETSITWAGKPMAGALIDRILSMKAGGFSIDPMIRFLGNLQENPSYRSREQLYSFLEYNNIPITDDGYFMAYKRIRGDWTDTRTGTVDNHVGQNPRMMRSEVDDDPTRTCSFGYHVAGLDYLKSYAGSRLVGVKVDPADVVSVPIDYHNTKMRVAAYEVIEELPMSLVGGSEDHWGGTPVVDNAPKAWVIGEGDMSAEYVVVDRDAKFWVLEHNWDGRWWDDVSEEWVNEMGEATRFTSEELAEDFRPIDGVFVIELEL